LTARSNGVKVTWTEMGEKTVKELSDMMAGDEEDPKDV
jgi:hypothetical protein